MTISNVLLMAQQGQNPLSTFLPLVLIAVVFYFFMIRPQTKKMKDQKKFIEELKKGDKVVTIGGIQGKIAEVAPDTFLVEVDHNVRIRVLRSAISLDNSKAANAAPAEDLK
jgi:preprotein translocase subunit YajC